MRRTVLICLALVSAAAPAAARRRPAPRPPSRAPRPRRPRSPASRLCASASARCLRSAAATSGRPARKNTVIFRGPDGRSAFAKPRRASRTKLVVRVPAGGFSPRRARAGGTPKATRFKLRVLAGRFSKFTSRRLSPVVVPAGSRRRCRRRRRRRSARRLPRNDYDGDLLPNATRWGSSSIRASRTPTATRSRTATSTRRPSTSTTIRARRRCPTRASDPTRTRSIPATARRPAPTTTTTGCCCARSSCSGSTTRTTASPRLGIPASLGGLRLQRRPSEVELTPPPAPGGLLRLGRSTSTRTACSPTTSVTPTPTAWATGTRSAGG